MSRFTVFRVLVLSLGLMGGNGLVCDLVAATTGAAMACCHGEPDCPLHESHSQGTPSVDVSHAPADPCCAMSDGDTSDMIPAVGGSVPGVEREADAVDVVDLRPFTATAAGRVCSSPPVTVVARHLLLSVFLV